MTPRAQYRRSSRKVSIFSKAFFGLRGGKTHYVNTNMDLSKRVLTKFSHIKQHELPVLNNHRTPSRNEHIYTNSRRNFPMQQESSLEKLTPPKCFNCLLIHLERVISQSSPPPPPKKI